MKQTIEVSLEEVADADNCDIDYPVFSGLNIDYRILSIFYIE